MITPDICEKINFHEKGDSNSFVTDKSEVDDFFKKSSRQSSKQLEIAAP